MWVRRTAGLACCCCVLWGAVTCLAQDPPAWQRHMEAANALRLRNDLAGAVKEYREVVRLNPAFAPAHMNVGLLEYARRSYTEALSSLRKATQLDPKMGPAWLYQGIIL